jgi:hypothetical protein
MVGYATAYTMLPVFSLVLDRDVNEDVALLYPELYKELTKVSGGPRRGEAGATRHGSSGSLSLTVGTDDVVAGISRRITTFRVDRSRTRLSSVGS